MVDEGLPDNTTPIEEDKQVLLGKRTHEGAKLAGSFELRQKVETF